MPETSDENLPADQQPQVTQTKEVEIREAETTAPRDKLLMDATVAPQDITFPTDLKLLNRVRCKSEELIDTLYDSFLHGPQKPPTYRQVAREMF